VTQAVAQAQSVKWCSSRHANQHQKRTDCELPDIAKPGAAANWRIEKGVASGWPARLLWSSLPRPDPPVRVQLRELHNVILQHNLAFSTRIVQRNPHASNAHGKFVLEDSPGFEFSQRLEYNCKRRDGR